MSEPVTIDRRAFLRRLGFGTVAAAAAAIGVFDVERLLWVPGEKTIFLPAADVVFAESTLAFPDWVTREALRVLANQLTLLNAFNRPYDLQGAAAGDLVPVRLTVTRGGFSWNR